MSNILAIDTSSALLSVAIKKDGQPIKEATLEGFLSHAEKLLPSIDDLLKEENLKIADIDTFLIGRGPGSFTGLRIGFATLKAIRVLREIRVFGAMTLDLIAGNVDALEEPSLFVAQDARRERIFVKKYTYGELGWTAEGDAKVLNADQFQKAAAAPCAIVGDAIGKYGEQFKSWHQNIRLLDENAWYPRASTMIPWSEKNGSPLVELKTPVDFVPLYIRDSEPEERQKENARSH